MERTYVGRTFLDVVSGGECRSTRAVLPISARLQQNGEGTYSVQETLGIFTLSLVIGRRSFIESIGDLFVSLSPEVKGKHTRLYSCFIPSLNACALSLADIVIRLLLVEVCVSVWCVIASVKER